MKSGLENTYKNIVEDNKGLFIESDRCLINKGKEPIGSFSIIKEKKSRNTELQMN